jgi:hypothetical protein
VRFRHTLVYALCFVPVTLAQHIGLWDSLAFLFLLFVFHGQTDSWTFRSTLGDWIGWQFLSKQQREIEHRQAFYGPTKIHIQPATIPDHAINSLPPNPWTSIPLIMDQTIHFIQIAVLAGFFLV